MKFHNFTGIGEVSAAMVMASLAANPSTLPLTTGIPGKILFYILKIFFTYLASLGLIVLNVGAEKIETVAAENNYDGTWDSAEKSIKQIRDTGRDLTPEEIEAIDQTVIEALRRFARFGKKKEGRGVNYDEGSNLN